MLNPLVHGLRHCLPSKRTMLTAYFHSWIKLREQARRYVDRGVGPNVARTPIGFRKASYRHLSAGSVAELHLQQLDFATRPSARVSPRRRFPSDRHPLRRRCGIESFTRRNRWDRTLSWRLSIPVQAITSRGWVGNSPSQFPDVLRRQQRESRRLRSQYAPEKFWADDFDPATSAKQCLFGQVAFGTLTTDLLSKFGIQSNAVIGQSLGESASLFGQRVWLDRDLMLERIELSSIFGSDLAPPYNAARKHWATPADETIEWMSGNLATSADDVRALLRPALRVFLLIATTPNECVIGGVA